MAPNDRVRAPDRLLETETGSSSFLRKHGSPRGLPEDVLREASHTRLNPEPAVTL
jgi:hypothetical protein